MCNMGSMTSRRLPLEEEYKGCRPMLEKTLDKQEVIRHIKGEKRKPFLNVEKSEISQHPRNPLVSFGGDSL